MGTTVMPKSFYYGADNRIWTYTVAHGILSPARLPVSPYPQLFWFYISAYKFVKRYSVKIRKFYTNCLLKTNARCIHSKQILEETKEDEVWKLYLFQCSWKRDSRR